MTPIEYDGTRAGEPEALGANVTLADMALLRLAIKVQFKLGVLIAAS